MLTFNVSASTEVMGACGRADITAEAGDYLYVLENNSKSREKSDTPVCEIVALEKVDNWI